MAAPQSTWEQMVSAGLWHDGQPLRIHLGCGARHIEGFINIDAPPDPVTSDQGAADVYVDLLALEFPEGLVDEIRFSEGVDRLPEGWARALLSRARRWLRPGATLTVGGRLLEPLVSSPGGAGPGDASGLVPEHAAQALRDARDRRRVGWIRERAERLPRGTRVLDVGFEGPADAPNHQPLFAHCEYSFFDLRAFLESARGPARDHAQGNGLATGGYRVPVADASFDVVMCTSVFEWALQPEAALAEVLRTLRPDGALWVAPPRGSVPAGSPPRATAGLTFAWYAAAFAKQGLEVGDAFASAGLFGELSATCLEAGARLAEVDLEPARRTGLEEMLLRDLPLAFGDLETKYTLESPRAAIILEARRSPAAPSRVTARNGASSAAAAETPELSVRARLGERPLRITYLITSILGVTGGNMTLLNQVEALRRRGHAVTIVTYTPRPTWTRVEAPVVQVPSGQPMAPRVPESDAVVATYFQNALELPKITAPVKVYYAQGDQFVFEDDTPFPNRDAERVRQALKAGSRDSYLLPGVHLVANSNNLADAVFRAHGVRAEAILPVCTDQTIFRPVGRAAQGSRLRILVVGPDTRGTGVESLVFKGIADIRKALELVHASFPNFTAVRISNTPPDIFQGFACEYHHIPSDEMKTFLFGTADLLVYASHFDSCPRPPQEAMAAGAGVVCTATSGAREYCVHEENCLLVPIKDPRAIADAVLRLAGDRALLERLVQGGRKTAAQFPREREWNELEALLYRYAEGAGILS